MTDSVESAPADALWHRWMDLVSEVHDELVESFSLRRQFREFFDVFKANRRLQQTGGHVWRWMLVCYLNTILVRIRRHAIGQTHEASLRQLLEQIRKRPDVPSAARAVGERRGPSDHLHANRLRDFADRWTGGVDGGAFNPAAVFADLGRLKQACREATEAANRHFIHLHQGVPSVVVQFGDVDRALDEIEAVHKRYHGLLLGTSLYQLEPAPQFNTHECFTFPWWVPPSVEEAVLTVNRNRLLRDEQALLYHLCDLAGDRSIEVVWFDPESPEFNGYLPTSFQGLLEQNMLRRPEQPFDERWHYRLSGRGWLVGVKRGRLDDTGKDFAEPPPDVESRIRDLCRLLKSVVDGRRAVVPVRVPLADVEVASRIPSGWIRNSIESHLLQYSNTGRIVNCSYESDASGDWVVVPSTFMQPKRLP